RADLAARVHPLITHCAPIREFGTEAERRIRSAHELALVDRENAMNGAQGGQTALLRKKVGLGGDARLVDYANRHGLRAERASERGGGHPSGDASTHDDDFSD